MTLRMLLLWITAVLVAGCSAGVAPTPQIIYVTQPPATPAPAAASSAPTVAPTAEPTPATTTPPAVATSIPCPPPAPSGCTITPGADSTVTPAPVGQPNGPWPPDGYTILSKDGNVVYQPITNPKCAYSTGQCYAIYAIARAGCPRSLYVEASLLDQTGTVIGFTNDSIGAVRPNERALLTFDFFKAASSIRMSKVSCL